MTEFKQKQSVLRRACDFHGYKWPENLSSGVMFFEGERVLIEEFIAYKKIMREASQ